MKELIMKELIKGVASVTAAVFLWLLFYGAIIAVPVIILALAVKWIIG